MSERIMNPTTTTGESSRQNQASIDSSPGDQESIRHSEGTIASVDTEGYPFITAYADDGSPLANGNLIPLHHSPSEIAERWGTIRVGMRVRVAYKGIDGSSASATIIGVEGEKNSEQPFLENNAERGLFAIFTPGTIG